MSICLTSSTYLSDSNTIVSVQFFQTYYATEPPQLIKTNFNLFKMFYFKISLNISVHQPISYCSSMHFKNSFLLCLLFVSSLYSSIAFSIPSSSSSDSEYEYEQCFYQINDRLGKLIKINYGQCMNTNGPDGCCLEGHYKPGICSNLGHLCCTKPDPDCSDMKNNKGNLLQSMPIIVSQS